MTIHSLDTRRKRSGPTTSRPAEALASSAPPGEDDALELRERAVAGVTRYIQQAVETGDGRSLNQRDVAKVIGVSHESLRKFGLTKVLRDAKRKLRPTTKRKKSSSRLELEARVTRANADALRWEGMYRETLGRLMTIEHNVRLRAGVSMAELLRPIPKPDRSHTA